VPEDKDDVGEAQLGSSAQRYRWLQEINRGGVGVILGARDPVIGRRVAIKVLRPELENDERILGEFSQEAQVTGQLDHPNIVPVYDFGAGDRSPFMVMKWIAGKSLAQLLRDDREPARRPDQLRQLIQIVLRTCDALSFAHSRGVIHCDLKPENVMVGDHGQVYLMDWGMALLRSSQLAAKTRSEAEESREAGAELPALSEYDSMVQATGQELRVGQARGTPAYMAPEQVFGLVDEIDERTDVFGVGGVLCEILLGEPPNNQRTLIGSGAPGRHWSTPSRGAIGPQLPPELCRITSKALAPKRGDRYPSIAALRADLDQFLEGGGWFETLLFRKGQVIVSEGDAGDTAYIIEQGSCEVSRLIEGRQVSIRRLAAGAVFGEMAVFTRGPRTATVVALEDVTVKVISGESLNRELDRNPWVAAFVRSLAGLLRDTEESSSNPPVSR
jgi:eukaryotic-like serine/threonine-protein kinase